jgi:hypothetical protein
MGLVDGGPQPVAEGVPLAEDPGQFVPVLGPDAKAARPAFRPAGGLQQGAGGADADDPGAAARIQNPAGQGQAPVEKAGKSLEEEPGPPVYVRGTEQALGQGKAEFKAPELENGFFAAVGFQIGAVGLFRGFRGRRGGRGGSGLRPRGGGGPKTGGLRPGGRLGNEVAFPPVMGFTR